MHRQRQYWNLIDVSWQWDKANACLGVVRVGRDSIAWSQVAHHDNYYTFIGKKQGKTRISYLGSQTANKTRRLPSIQTRVKQ